MARTSEKAHRGRFVAMRYGNLPMRAELEERAAGTVTPDDTGIPARFTLERWTVPARFADGGATFLRMEREGPEGFARAWQYGAGRRAKAERDWRAMLADVEDLITERTPPARQEATHDHEER